MKVREERKERVPREEKKEKKEEAKEPPSQEEIEASMRQASIELHKPARRNYDTRPVVVQDINTIWGADLIHMEDWVEDTKQRDIPDGYRYALTVVDIWSRYAWVEPLSTKTGAEVMAALKKIMRRDKRKPKKLWIDQGSEFTNKNTQAWLEREGIESYHTFGKSKSAVVERFNRTLKTNLFREMDATNSHDWGAILEKTVDDYNKAGHRGLTIKLTVEQAKLYPELSNNGQSYTVKLSPEQAEKYPELTAQIHHDRIQANDAPQIKKFKVGDRVRVSRLKGRHEKGYDQNWTREIFTVSEVHETKPITYSVVDRDGEAVHGTLYNEELLKTQIEDDGVALIVGDPVEYSADGKRALVQLMGIDGLTWVDADTLTDV